MPGVGKVRRHVPEVSAEIPTRASGANIAEDLTRRDQQAGDQAAGPMTEVLELAAFRPARTHRPAWVLALQGLDAGLLIDTQDQFTLLVQTRRIQVQPGNVQGLRFKKIGIVTVQPLNAAVRFQVAFALKYRETADLEERVASLEEELVSAGASALEEGFVEEKGATDAEAAGATN
jgi:hypothetical protein